MEVALNAYLNRRAEIHKYNSVRRVFDRLEMGWERSPTIARWSEPGNGMSTLEEATVEQRGMSKRIGTRIDRRMVDPTHDALSFIHVLVTARWKEGGQHT